MNKRAFFFNIIMDYILFRAPRGPPVHHHPDQEGHLQGQVGDKGQGENAAQCQMGQNV